ncbi:hypothetical protein [Streptomyces xantholiticus]|uniref:hypothetical protein n=1 Tax=Streptomyces xantholiticus TaxID=68285 RepID=UPI001675F886|nr:hypothetical protein [Streptomyces xantholiticus]
MADKVAYSFGKDGSERMRRGQGPVYFTEPAVSRDTTWRSMKANSTPAVLLLLVGGPPHACSLPP